MKLTELRRSVSDMSAEELLELLQAMRTNRRKPAEKPKPKRAAKKTKTVETAMSKLTPEEVAKLIEALS